MDKPVKTEEDDFDFTVFDQAVAGENSLALALNSENHEGHVDSEAEIAKKEKPVWFPSAKGRSIVWEHITWTVDNQKAACRYCNAEFQVKGGTSALLRHLKAIHPAAINFDPETAPPVARRKRKKIEDYTIVTEDTKSYMDNLLEQFLHDEAATPSEHSLQAQNRADSEIDEVIRNLQQENVGNGGEQQEADQDLRKLLGIVEEQNEQEEETVPIPDEEKEVSSSSGTCKKRKADDGKAANPEFSAVLPFAEVAKQAKYTINLASTLRRPPPPPPPPPHLFPHPLAPHHIGVHHGAHPNSMLPSSSSVPIPTGPPPGVPQKYNAHAVSVLDFEAKVLYNQTMHSTIAREDAMTSYYRMKARKLELEIKKLERELGEEDGPDGQEDL